MTNHKIQQIMAYKARVRTNEEKAGMASLLARVRERREAATKEQQELRNEEDVKNVEGVRAGAHAGFFDLRRVG